ncbi:sulfite reductase subunit alpha [Bordetella sp. 15P40C-2]|uniref:sulfite reductase subunit alpha n=1 Tax=Bordetella sp. 15P40C-2 TaxID=2572246 RepID=UPI0013656418|nr:sulfite reductase subunit alpha [Bordetella sp. 15P40C-2]
MSMSPTHRLICACCVVALWLLLCLWAWHQARIRHRKVAEAASALTAPVTSDTILIAHASQTGQAESLAQQTAQTLSLAGVPTRVAALGQLNPAVLRSYPRVLIVASTYGEGDPPDNAAAFADSISGMPTMALDGLQYALLALGDSTYRHFCGFGRQLDGWLRNWGATPLFDRVDVDRIDAGALRHWVHQLGQMIGQHELPDWETPAYQPWRLTARTLLNPGSQGEPCFHLELTALDPDNARWQPGDIAEIGPRKTRGGDVLPHREYSIASVPSDGAVHLLVRLRRNANGGLGVGSGWLTQIAQIGDLIDLRLRSNENFRPPQDARGALFIGNGTGIAGLRALLKARIAAGHHRNWLIFGERNAATDGFYREELQAWLASGRLHRLDLTFSRDDREHPYVQHRLLQAADSVREWVNDGADIYVCGSLNGMAQDVDQALQHILGSDAMTRLRQEGRYHRDVY